MIENENTLQLKHNTPEVQLDHTATQHRNHEASCRMVFSQIVKRLAT